MNKQIQVRLGRPLLLFSTIAILLSMASACSVNLPPGNPTLLNVLLSGPEYLGICNDPFTPVRTTVVFTVLADDGTGMMVLGSEDFIRDTDNGDPDNFEFETMIPEDGTFIVAVDIRSDCNACCWDPGLCGPGFNGEPVWMGMSGTLLAPGPLDILIVPMLDGCENCGC